MPWSVPEPSSREGAAINFVFVLRRYPRITSKAMTRYVMPSPVRGGEVTRCAPCATRGLGGSPSHAGDIMGHRTSAVTAWWVGSSVRTSPSAHPPLSPGRPGRATPALLHLPARASRRPPPSRGGVGINLGSPKALSGMFDSPW